jgi:regulator-associated protein of mTOR
VWNYEEATLLNGFDNNDFPDKGISNLCLVNELDDSLLLVASCDGSVRIWKDYATKGRQKLVTGFSSIQGQKPGASGLNAVVDWQQQSGYLVYGHSINNMLSFYIWSCETYLLCI